MHQTVAELRRKILRSSRFVWLMAVCLSAAPMLALADDDTPTDSTPVAETTDEPADEPVDETTSPVDEPKADADEVKKPTSLDTPQQMFRTFLTAMRDKDLDTAITPSISPASIPCQTRPNSTKRPSNSRRSSINCRWLTSTQSATRQTACPLPFLPKKKTHPSFLAVQKTISGESRQRPFPN